MYIGNEHLLQRQDRPRSAQAPAVPLQRVGQLGSTVNKRRRSGLLSIIDCEVPMTVGVAEDQLRNTTVETGDSKVEQQTASSPLQ